MPDFDRSRIALKQSMLYLVSMRVDSGIMSIGPKADAQVFGRPQTSKALRQVQTEFQENTKVT